MKAHAAFVLILASHLAGCVSTQYRGAPHAATTRVDVFADASRVTRPYEVMGTATARGGESLPRHAIEADLAREGQARGADAVIVVPRVATCARDTKTTLP
jgi:hypothetical protein